MSFDTVFISIDNSANGICPNKKYCLNLRDYAFFSVRFLGFSIIIFLFSCSRYAQTTELENSTSSDLKENVQEERVDVEIKSFSISWNPEQTKLGKLNYNQLLHQYLDELGPKLTIEQMHLIAARLTRELRELGYQFHRVIVPGQNLMDKVLKLAIIEGVVGIVDIRNNKHYSTKLINRPFKKIQGGPIYQPKMEEAVTLVNEYPGLSVFSYYSRGNNTGEANVNVSVMEEDRFSLRLQLDNYGSEVTGTDRVFAGISLNNPLGFGDRIGLSLSRTTESNNSIYGSLGYEFPLFSPRHQAEINVSRNDFEIGASFVELELAGEVEGTTLRYQYKLYRRQNSAINFNLSIAQNTSDISTRLADLSALLNRTEESESVRFGWDGYRFLKSRVFGFGGGLDMTHGEWEITRPDMNLSEEAVAQPDYQKLGLSQWVQWRTSKPEKWNAGLLSIKIDGQYTQRAVPAIEKMGLTGPALVRGERAGFYSADRGVVAQLEWRWLFPRWLGNEFVSKFVTPSLFYQQAYGERFSPDESIFSRASISSTGIAFDIDVKSVGVNISFAQLLNVEIDSVDTQQNGSLILATLAYQW